MKKLFLLSLAMSIGIFAMAQNFGKVPVNLKNLPAKRLVHATVDMPMDLSTGSNPYVKPHQGKATHEIAIGTTRYDLQTNSSVQNRVYLFPDNTVGATFTYGSAETSFPERGTGYNYYNGTAFGPYPTARIESARCGWPSYMPLPGGGELVITHDGTAGLLVSKRATKGTGSWTTTSLVGPMTTGNTTCLLWPRAIASGNTIHVIACTDQATTGTYYYHGLALALVYYKSTDGGATWSAPAILTGMDSASIVRLPNRSGFSGDGYSWAAPKGDTIAFVVGDSWLGEFAMKSFDAGATWTKIPIYDFPLEPTAPTPVIPTCDGSSAIALDNNGKVHVVFGKLRVSDDSYTDSPATSSYYPYTDGLIYWNENMAPLDSGLLDNDSLLYLAGNYIAAMMIYPPDTSIVFPTVGTGQWPFGNYYTSLTSMPQIIIDNNKIFVTYSSVREDKDDPGANPNEQLYRHLYAMGSNDLGTSWYDPIDITGVAFHDFDECVFGSLSFTSQDDSLHIVYQADNEPGLAVRGDSDPYDDNTIYYITVPKDDLFIGIKENQESVITNASIYPNPSKNNAHISLNLNSEVNVKITVINMLGQTMFTKDYGKRNAGQSNFDINTHNFNDGIYFVSIQAGNSRHTQKLIIE